MQTNRKSFGTLKSDRYVQATVMDEWPLWQLPMYFNMFFDNKRFSVLVHCCILLVCNVIMIYLGSLVQSLISTTSFGSVSWPNI